jgi:hypothetical protein
MSADNINLGRVQQVLWTQLERFKGGFDETPIPEVQDLRGLSIAWIAVFFQEAVPSSFLDSLMELVLRLRSHEDFSHHGWFRLIPLDVALFALTGNRDWLCYVASNLGHGTSGHRDFVIRSFALVANRLTFDRLMLDRTAYNLQVRHGGCEDLVILYAVSDQKGSEKKQQIAKWLSQFTLNPPEEECLRHLAAGEFAVNPFLRHFLWIQQYVWLSFACDLPVARKETLAEQKLPDKTVLTVAGAQPQLAGFTLDSDTVWHRMRAHPLMASHVITE